MAGMPLGDERADHALDRQVHLGHQIDRALLVDLERAAEAASWIAPAFDASTAVCRLSRWPEKGRVEGRIAAHSAAFASFLTMRTSIPPSGMPAQLDVVHEVADQEDAAAAALEHVLGRERVGDFFGLEALAFVAHG